MQFLKSISCQIQFLFRLNNILTCGIVSATWSNKKRKPFAVFNSFSTISKKTRVSTHHTFTGARIEK